MISRAVPLSEEQYLFIEDLGKEFMRADQLETATKLLAIALAWKVSPVLEPALNIFKCDIDESAGMADVVKVNTHEGYGDNTVIELRGYSRKTPCA